MHFTQSSCYLQTLNKAFPHSKVSHLLLRMKDNGKSQLRQKVKSTFKFVNYENEKKGSELLVG